MTPDGVQGGQGRSSNDVRRDACGAGVLFCVLFSLLVWAAIGYFLTR